MEDLLYNPVYNALLTGDRAFSKGSDHVKYFDEEVSPFVGFPTGYSEGFDELYALFPVGRKILYAAPVKMEEPRGWKTHAVIEGLQFVYDGAKTVEPPIREPVPLDATHVKEMISLAKLTKPGPFGPRTIEFGHYHGIFEGGRLVAMTGQRMHIGNYTEVSAVCTHPDFLGRGFAQALLVHQLGIILRDRQTPILHVRADNQRAISLYERLSFRVNRPMNFYFMKKV